MKEIKSNGLEDIISQAIEEMKSEQGNNFSMEKINLAKLERRTGVSRARLKRLKANNFNQKPHGLVGQKQQSTVLSGYSAYLDKLLCQGITNSMVCHHCGQRYVEFFPNAKQENLFIGMIHAFGYMGIPKYILTDNMKSVVLHRDFEGHPVWQKDYEAFMKTVGFQTRLCKPRHPFTKGKVERLVRFVKENFLVGRVFWNITDLNRAALDWCNRQNSTYHNATAGVPQEMHYRQCAAQVRPLEMEPALLYTLSYHLHLGTRYPARP